MVIKNVRIFRENKTFLPGTIVIKDGVIRKLAFEQDGAGAGRLGSIGEIGEAADEILDGGGCYAIPGLIDIHFHGCMGSDFCDGTREAIKKIAEYEASIGVTAIAPATMTLPVDTLEEILAEGARFRRENRDKHLADLIGVNMEGPFISEEKKGAQDQRYITFCNAEIYRRFQKAAEGLVKYIGIAPEKGDALPFIQEVKDEVRVSLAHTNADYAQAMAAFNAGACHAVHLYNAMPAFSHRAPGVIGAVSDSSHVMAELICDGIHIHPSVVRATLKMLGEDRVIFISDSMRAAGMPDGRYTLGGLDVDVRDGRAVLASNGALAGSATNLMNCVKTAVTRMQIPLASAVACASVNPAKSLGVYEEYGSIDVGKKGNVVLLTEELDVVSVVKDGEVIHGR